MFEDNGTVRHPKSRDNLVSQRYITSFDGLKLLYREYQPLDRNPKAAIMLVHGFGEHSGRFLHVIELLAARGFSVFTMDLRGHGYSGGPRADGKFEWMLKDMRILHKETAKQSHNLPLFFYAHSMGGLLTFKYLIQYPHADVVGVVITSPLLRLIKGKQPAPWKVFLLKQCGQFLKEVLVESNVDPCSLSAKNEVVTSLFHDRLVLPFMTMRFAREMFMAMEEVHEKRAAFQHPLLLIHGDCDTVTCPVASRELFPLLVGSADKTFHQVPDGLHELHNDIEQTNTLDTIFSWLDRRLEGALERGAVNGKWSGLPDAMANHEVQHENVVPSDESWAALAQHTALTGGRLALATTHRVATLLMYLCFWPLFLLLAFGNCFRSCSMR